MTERAAATRPRPQSLFGNLRQTAENHFRIVWFGAVLGLLDAVADSIGSSAQAVERFPFLVGYNNELARRLDGLPPDAGCDAWWKELAGWETDTAAHLPLRALGRILGLDHQTQAVLLTIGLAEEDARFASVWEALQGGNGLRRPTLGFLRHAGLGSPAQVSTLLERGLAQCLNPDAPRPDWQLQIPAPIWDALRQQTIPGGTSWLKFMARDELPRLKELTLEPELSLALDRLPELIRGGKLNTVVLRGARHNGRHAALGALARALESGILEVRGLDRGDDERWRQVGGLSVLLHAVPIITVEPGPGESLALTELLPAQVPLGIALGRAGGVSGTRMQHAAALTLPMPDTRARREHWASALPEAPSTTHDELARHFRIGSGQIHRLAAAARTQACLQGASAVAHAHVQEAARGLGREALDTLAKRVPASGGWDDLCVAERTQRELRHFCGRCRHREDLAGALALAPGGTSVGVRALFTGPSGTGKTLAARVLAAALQKDLYRVDLSAVVNKYIGETEKNLNRIFERAEDLDVILLLDEGDSLLTRRTDVQTANDRYANLETNFLLQRLESYEGILIITTNAAARIDAAFQRRMDVVVEFTPPTPAVRLSLWQLHLPGHHRVDNAALGELAVRCELTGAQIRNAVLHATLLGMQDGGQVTTAFLEEALRREYARQGLAAPLRPPTPD